MWQSGSGLYGRQDSQSQTEELEHKAMWTLKKLNLDWGVASSKKRNVMNELDEFSLKAYESLALYKEKMKKYLDQKFVKCEFDLGDMVI